MGTYKLNNVDLASYGIIPRRADNSNIALAGAWDMPARINKTFHDWGDNNGVEAYTDAQEIFWEGRDLTFTAAMKEADKEAVMTKLVVLYNDMDAFTGLVTFSTPWGDYEVYLKDEIAVNYLKNGICTLTLKFREPQPDLTSGIIPASTSAQYGIDGIGFSDLGLKLLIHSGGLYEPSAKQQNVTFYEIEKFQITKRQQRDFMIDCLIMEDNYAAFLSRIKALYKLFSSEGVRIINVPGDTQRNVFMKDGFHITKMMIKANMAFARLTIKLTNAD